MPCAGLPTSPSIISPPWSPTSCRTWTATTFRALFSPRGWFAHPLSPERPLQTARHGSREGNGVADPHGGAAQQHRRRCGGSDRANRHRGVPGPVVARLHRQRDAPAHLVAGATLTGAATSSGGVPQ